LQRLVQQLVVGEQLEGTQHLGLERALAQQEDLGAVAGLPPTVETLVLGELRLEIWLSENALQSMV